MNTRTASTLPKSVQEILAYKPRARMELIRIEWDDTMVMGDGRKYFKAIYEVTSGGSAWATDRQRKFEKANSVIIIDWCPHEKYGK